MKKIILFFALILLLPNTATALPFLMCDPPPIGTIFPSHYVITGDTYWVEPVISQADGSLRSDVGSIPVGEHNILVSACQSALGWPEVCSTPVPFTFVRPYAPSAPANLRLVQQ